MRQWFRGGLVFKAHRLVYRSTLRLRVIKKREKKIPSHSTRFAAPQGARLGKSRRPCLAANWAALPQKWPSPPRNVADSCELTTTTAQKELSISRLEPHACLPLRGSNPSVGQRLPVLPRLAWPTILKLTCWVPRQLWSGNEARLTTLVGQIDWEIARVDLVRQHVHDHVRGRVQGSSSRPMTCPAV